MATIIVSKTILLRENYPLWARKNQTTLIIEDLWKYITDERDSNEDEKIVAMSVIPKLPDDNTKMDFIGYEFPKTLWEALRAKYTVTTQSQLFTVQQELNNVRLTPDITLDQYVQKLKFLFNNLKMAKVPFVVKHNVSCD